MNLYLSDIRLNRRKLINFLGMALILVMCIACHRIVSASSKEPYRILCIQSSTAPDYNLACRFMIEEELKKSGLPVQFLYILHQTLDQKTKDAVQILYDRLNKYNQTPPDLILAVNDEALNDLLATHHPFSYNVPIVFSNVFFPDTGLLHQHTNITGQIEKADFVQAYRLAQRLFGPIEELQFILGFQRIDHQFYDQQIQQIKQIPELAYIRDISTQGPESTPLDTLSSCDTLSHPLTVGFDWVTIWPMDQFARYYDKQKPLFPVRRVSIKPGEEIIYHSFFSYQYSPTICANNSYFLSRKIKSISIPTGMIGGYMNPKEKQIQTAIHTALRLLKGTPPHRIAIDTASTIPVFEWNAMQYWQIDEKQLPAGSVVINKPFFLAHKKELFAGLFIFVGMLGGIIYWLYRYFKTAHRQGQSLYYRIRDEQAQIQTTVNSVNEGIISFDTKGILTSINPTAINLLQLHKPAEELIGIAIQTLLNLTPHDTYYPFLLNQLAEKARATKEKQLLPENTRLLLPNKKTLLISGTIRTLFLNGNAIGTLFTFQDKTDKARQSQFLSFSMASGDVYTWRFNDDAITMSFHESFFANNHIPHDGKNRIKYLDFCQLIHPHELTIWEKCLQKIYLNQQSCRETLQIRLLISDSYQWFEFRIASLPETTFNQASRFFGICLNIQNLKETEATLIKVRDQARESNRLKSEFLANMSHEIRTPLNAIVGFSSIICEETDLEERKQFTQLISDNCDMLLKTVNDILDISRVESGYPFQYKKYDLNDLLNEVYAEKSSLFSGTSVTFSIVLPRQTYAIQTDPFRIKQVLGQLIDNARRFTPEGSVSIGYEPLPDGQQTILYVQDSGIGIAPENREIIFERFYKLNSFTAGGGLGLSLCKEIVRRMEGRIWVDENTTTGTCMKICIPNHQPSEKKQPL